MSLKEDEPRMYSSRSASGFQSFLLVKENVKENVKERNAIRRVCSNAPFLNATTRSDLIQLKCCRSADWIYTQICVHLPWLSRFSSKNILLSTLHRFQARNSSSTREALVGVNSVSNQEYRPNEKFYRRSSSAIQFREKIHTVHCGKLLHTNSSWFEFKRIQIRRALSTISEWPEVDWISCDLQWPTANYRVHFQVGSVRTESQPRIT